NRGALLLAAGERHAALADDRLKSLRELLYLRRNVSSGRGFDNLLIARLIDAERNVLANGVREQEGLLRHEADRAPQRLQRILTDRSSIDHHHPRFRIL